MNSVAMKRKRKSVIDEFIALPDSEKERIFQGLEVETLERRLARSRPLNAKERKQWSRFKARAKLREISDRPTKRKAQ
jgi:hypothetical protein